MGLASTLPGAIEAEKYGRGGVGIAVEVVMSRKAGYSLLGRMQRKCDLIPIKRHRRDDFEGIAQFLIILEGHNDAADGLAVVYPMFVEIAHVPQDLAEDDIGCLPALEFDDEQFFFVFADGEDIDNADTDIQLDTFGGVVCINIVGFGEWQARPVGNQEFFEILFHIKRLDIGLCRGGTLARDKQRIQRIPIA